MFKGVFCGQVKFINSIYGNFLFFLGYKKALVKTFMYSLLQVYSQDLHVNMI